MINKNIQQFPIIYTSESRRRAIGWGAHTTVADECKAVNIKKGLIVTSGLKGTGIVDEIKSILNYNGVSTEIYNKVTSNPKDYQVMEAYQVFKEAECDGVVSVGGGSSHDCGKGVRAVATYDGKYLWDIARPTGTAWMKEMQKYRRITIPQIAVNTTAGTGAEVSGGAAITNTKARAKHGIDLMGEAPNMAITDPLLVRCMPQTIAAWTGWDAFAHAFESYVSCIQVPCTRAVQTGTIRIVAENLREFSFNRMNHEACERMCYAETMAGLGMMFGGGVGIVHGFGNGLGGLTDGHHGRLCAVLTLQGEKFNEPACPELFAGMAAAMGIDTRGMTTVQAADKWFDAVERLLADLNIQSGHLTEQFGFQQSDMESVVSEYLRGRMGEANPRGSSPEECTKLLKTMM